MFSTLLARDRGPVLDARGRPRTAVTLPAYRRGQRPPNFGKTYPVEVLTPGEVRRLIEACSRRGPSGLRNRALIVVLWRSGLRVSEATALHPKDVDLDSGTITVLHGKGDKRRVVGLDPEAGAVVQRWVACRRELTLARSAPLFCTIAQPMPGRPLHTAYLRELFKHLALKAGIEKRCHPHGLRHTFAYECRIEGMDLVEIQTLLGHRNLATTARYVSHLAPVEALARQRARVWGS